MNSLLAFGSIIKLTLKLYDFVLKFESGGFSLNPGRHSDTLVFLKTKQMDPSIALKRIPFFVKETSRKLIHIAKGRQMITQANIKKCRLVAPNKKKRVIHFHHAAIDFRS
jgi:hypothetical protein